MSSHAASADHRASGLAAFIDLLMPPRCPSCKEPVARAGLYCAQCWAGLQVGPAARCDCCAVPLPLAWSVETLCLACLRDPPPFRHTRTAHAYAGVARQTVLAFKNGAEHLAGLMAGSMVRAAAGLDVEGALVVPVPLHRWRLAGRGYNQSAWLARAVAQRLGSALLVDGLERHRFTGSTRGLDRLARQRAVAGAFRVPPGRRAAIAARPILLVDDVMTTGATAAAAARALKRAGATAVDVLVYARVAGDEANGYANSLHGGEAHGPG